MRETLPEAIRLWEQDALFLGEASSERYTVNLNRISPLPTRLLQLQDPPNIRKTPQLHIGDLARCSNIPQAKHESPRLTGCELFRSIISELDTALCLLHRYQLFHIIWSLSEIFFEIQTVVDLPRSLLADGRSGGRVQLSFCYFIYRNLENLPYNFLELRADAVWHG